MYRHIKKRLIATVHNRNYFFKDTKRADALNLLMKKTRFKGLSDERIAALEEELNTIFPDDFREYLKTFGENGGDLFVCGADLNPNQLVDYQKWGKALLSGEGFESHFNENSLIFEFHQGYSCCYFHTNEEGEFGVYQYTEGQPVPRKLYNSFAEMLDMEMKIIEHRVATMRDTECFMTMRDGRIVEMSYSNEDGKKPSEIGDRFID